MHWHTTKPGKAGQITGDHYRTLLQLLKILVAAFNPVFVLWRLSPWRLNM